MFFCICLPFGARSMEIIHIPLLCVSCIPIAYWLYSSMLNDWSFLLGFLKWIRLQTQGHKNRFVVDAGGGGGPWWSGGPMFFSLRSLLEGMVMSHHSSRFEILKNCVTPAYWIRNWKDSTVTVWWQCDCFVGICRDWLNCLRFCHGRQLHGLRVNKKHNYWEFPLLAKSVTTTIAVYIYIQ